MIDRKEASTLFSSVRPPELDEMQLYIPTITANAGENRVVFARSLIEQESHGEKSAPGDSGNSEGQEPKDETATSEISGNPSSPARNGEAKSGK